MFFVPTLSLFFVVITFLGLGAVASFLTIPFKAQRFANAFTHGSAVLASMAGIVFSFLVLTSGTELVAHYNSAFPLFSYAFRVDGLSAFFMLIISLATLAASVYGYGYVRRDVSIRPGIFGFFYTLFIASMYMVTVANNGIFFLIAWECMSLTSYFLIVHEHGHADHVRAGYLYLLMTSIGTTCLMLAIVLLSHVAGTYDFDAIRAVASHIPLVVKHAALAAALVGLGIKAGIVPLHIWLPEAHPAAPSHVSALLSGVMLKMAIYMMVRFFFDFVGLPHAIWWGVIILALGIVSALLGVLYALAEHDLKRLLAYHSVENIGIIFLGIGSALVFAGMDSYVLATVALSAALFHTLNHAIFKGLLFLGAGSVVQTTATRNMERYGGLIRILPLTTFFFLVGSLAISGLPPFNGFASEWLTFQALLSGVATTTLYLKVLFVASIGALALTSGLAAACFVKAVGVTFLARPRAPLPEGRGPASREPITMQIGMGFLAILTLTLGLGANYVYVLIAHTLDAFGLTGGASSATLFASIDTVTAPGPYTLSIPLIVGVLLVVVGCTYVITRMFTPSSKACTGPVWACGAPLEVPAFAGTIPRTQITATAFARTLILVFSRLVSTHVERTVTTDETGRAHERIATHLVDVWHAYVYTPVCRVLLFGSLGIRKLQNGNVNTYLLYMFIALCVLLIVSV